MECPFCGESIDDDAQACPHCGSDDETGWKPDLDYYAVELPDEDSDPPGDTDDRSVWSRGDPIWPGPVLLLAAVAFFLFAALSTYGWAGIVPIAFLLGCALVFVLGVRGPRRS